MHLFSKAISAYNIVRGWNRLSTRLSIPKSILVQHTLDRSIPYLTSMQSACLNQLPEVKFGFSWQRILTCQINDVTILVLIWRGRPGLSLIFFVFNLSKPSFWRLQAFLIIPDACAAYLSMPIVYKPLNYRQRRRGKPFLLILWPTAQWVNNNIPYHLP